MYVEARQWITADLTAALSVTSEQLKDTDWPSHTEVIQRRLFSRRSVPEFKDSPTPASFSSDCVPTAPGTWKHG